MQCILISILSQGNRGAHRTSSRTECERRRNPSSSLSYLIFSCFVSCFRCPPFFGEHAVLYHNQRRTVNDLFRLFSHLSKFIKKKTKDRRTQSRCVRRLSDICEFQITSSSSCCSSFGNEHPSASALLSSRARPELSLWRCSWQAFHSPTKRLLWKE